MGLFLGWPIHRARGAPEEAPALGQRQAGAACFPRQSTNAPEHGAWRPWRAQLVPVQPPPVAAASPPPGPSPRRAQGPRGPTPSPPSRGRLPLLASAPGAACRPRAPRPALRSLQTPVLPRLSSALLLIFSFAFIAFPLAVPSSPLHLSLPPFPLSSLHLPLIPTVDRPFCPQHLLDPLTLHCSSSPPWGCGLLCAPVPQCPPHLPRSRLPSWLSAWWPGPGGRKDGSRGKGLLLLAGTRAALVPPGFPCSSP